MKFHDRSETSIWPSKRKTCKYALDLFYEIGFGGVVMGAFKYTITIESDTPPQVMLGQNIGGGIVKELKQVEVDLVSAAHLAQKYNLSTTTIRERLVSINQGTQGKALYNPRLAHDVLTSKNKRGRPRAN